ncbi:MAG: hypothetical protein ACHQ2F_02270 [Desulfobaccales bacterium]
MEPGSNEDKFKQFSAAIRAAESACYTKITKICADHGLNGDNLSYDGIISIFWRLANRRFKEIKAGSN